MIALNFSLRAGKKNEGKRVNDKFSTSAISGMIDGKRAIASGSGMSEPIKKRSSMKTR